MKAVCDPTLWRERRGFEEAGSVLNKEQLALYNALRAKVDDGSAAIDTSLFPMADRWRERLIAEENAGRAGHV